VTTIGVEVPGGIVKSKVKCPEASTVASPILFPLRKISTVELGHQLKPFTVQWLPAVEPSQTTMMSGHDLEPAGHGGLGG
jgi:hypothetical protein